MDRWSTLFRDLETALEAESEGDILGAADELRRAEISRIALWQRLLAGQGKTVTVRTTHGGYVHGTVLDAQPQWVLLTAAGRDNVVPIARIATITGLQGAVPEESVYGQDNALRRTREITIPRMLRELAARRAYLTVNCAGHTEQGYALDVHADTIDLAVKSAPGVMGGQSFTTVAVALPSIDWIALDS